MVTQRKKLFLIAILLPIVIIVFMAFGFMGSYNNLIAQQENVYSSWSQVENQYQRRADLANQLVQAVDAQMGQEQFIFNKLVEQAQALGRAFSPQQPPNATEMDDLSEAISGFNQALINAVQFAADNPDIVSGDLMKTLMIQIEGSENRVTVARRDYNLAVESFRSRLRKFPTTIWAGLFNFNVDEFAYFVAEQPTKQAPQLNFKTP